MKKNRCKVSVIVPVYNKKEYIGECVDSILGQTHRNLELLLVDDASTDGSGEICDRYATQDDRVRVIHQPNGGPTAACVTGIENMSSDYCIFVDGDDYIDVCMLEEMTKHVVGRPGEIICCNHVLEKRKGTQTVLMRLAPGIYEGEPLKREVKDRLIGNEQRLILPTRCMKLYEKSVFEGNRKYYDMSVRLGEDLQMTYPAFLQCTRLVMMEQAAYYHYRFVENSMVRNYDAGMFDSIQACYRVLQRVIADHDVTDGQARLNREYCYLLMVVVKNELRNPDKEYLSRVRDILCRQEIRECILNTPLSVRERSNQLIYLGMQYPEKFLLRILHMIIRWYDRR